MCRCAEFVPAFFREHSNRAHRYHLRPPRQQKRKAVSLPRRRTLPTLPVSQAPALIVGGEAVPTVSQDPFLGAGQAGRALDRRPLRPGRDRGPGRRSSEDSSRSPISHRSSFAGKLQRARWQRSEGSSLARQHVLKRNPPRNDATLNACLALLQQGRGRGRQIPPPTGGRKRIFRGTGSTPRPDAEDSATAPASEALSLLTRESWLECPSDAGHIRSYSCLQQ